LRHQVSSGRWQRVRPGVIVAHNGPLTYDQRLWMAVLTGGPRAVLAGLAAARAGGLRRAVEQAIDILVPATTRVLQPGRSVARSLGVRIAVHRTTILPAKDVIERARPPRTSMARSIVDAAQWSRTDDAARGLIAAACRQRLVSSEEIAEVAYRMPKARRRSVVLETVGFTSRGAEALSEIDFVKLCRRAGLPLPDQQTRRRDASGRQRRVDATWREYGVAAEVDGEVHDEPEVQWDDMFRQNDLWIDDERFLRFPSWAIRNRPDQVAGQLRRALIRGGWTPPSVDLG
jgi:hypothetical protein